MGLDRPGVLLNTLPEGVLRCRVPQVTVVHDLIPLAFPRDYPRQQIYFRRLVPAILRESRVGYRVQHDSLLEGLQHPSVSSRAGGTVRSPPPPVSLATGKPENASPGCFGVPLASGFVSQNFHLTSLAAYCRAPLRALTPRRPRGAPTRLPASSRLPPLTVTSRANGGGTSPPRRRCCSRWSS